MNELLGLVACMVIGISVFAIGVSSRRKNAASWLIFFSLSALALKLQGPFVGIVVLGVGVGVQVIFQLMDLRKEKAL